MSWFKRYRHSKGFGIHSPFAYRFITEVLEERLPYYDFTQITDRRQRLVYRIACRLQPAAVWADSEAYTRVLQMACPSAAVDKGAAQLMVVSANGDTQPLADAIANGCAAVIIGKHQALMPLVLGWLDAMGYGMTFDNERSMAIVVPNQKLPRQDFTARF